MAAPVVRDAAPDASGWDQTTIRQRCRLLSGVAGEICRNSLALVDACSSPQRIDPVETITSELFPLCAALEFIGKRGPKLLAPRKLGLRGRPLWLFGVRSVVHRVPLGDVLVLGTWNYPLLLPGVQAAQALAGGNRVQLKPAPGTEAATEILAQCFWEAGIPKEQLRLLDSQPSAAQASIRQGVDLVVLTGSAETGRKVLSSMAPTLSASIMELSGCDAVIALPGADHQRLVDSIRFGLKFNGSATCIGPRRLLVRRNDHAKLVGDLVTAMRDEPAVVVHPAARQVVADRVNESFTQGAVDLLERYDDSRLRESGEMFPLLLDGVTASQSIASSDLFAPVLSIIKVDDQDQAADLVNHCPYRLAASVFGPTVESQRLASKLDVGCVTVNDLIMPTADPRIAFGGRGQSGFGVTRGEEGLLAMTAPRVVCTRRGKFTPHLRPRQPSDQDLLEGALHWTHADSWSARMAGLRRMIRAGKNSDGDAGMTPDLPNPKITSN